MKASDIVLLLDIKRWTVLRVDVFDKPVVYGHYSDSGYAHEEALKAGCGGGRYIVYPPLGVWESDDLW